MVGRVLRSHKIVERHSDSFRLSGFDELIDDQINQLIQACDAKLTAYIARRGEAIWQHRRKSSGAISGTVHYEGLRRASSGCELCGISNEKKALEVDHIITKESGRL